MLVISMASTDVKVEQNSVHQHDTDVTSSHNEKILCISLW